MKMLKFFLYSLQTFLLIIPGIRPFIKWIYDRTMRPYKNRQRNQEFLRDSPGLIRAAKNAFDEIGVVYWIEFGTLLGAERHQDLISHDLDVDFGMFLNDYDAEHEKIFKKYGLRKVREILVDDGMFAREETYIFGEATMDIFYFKQRKNGLCCTYSFLPEEGSSYDYTIEKYGGLRVLEECVICEGFGEAVLQGIVFPAPEPKGEHLRALYGENYMIPNPDWVIDTKGPYRRFITEKTGIRFYHNGGHRYV